MLKVNCNYGNHHVRVKHRKFISVAITSRCNLKCASCSQLCGVRRKRWDISLDQLKINLDVIKNTRKKSNRLVIIYGGEPTLHRQWEEVLQILRTYKTLRFTVCTNGRVRVTPEKDPQIKYRVNTLKQKNKGANIMTWHAPKDLYPRRRSQSFWKAAQRRCYLWKRCGVCIYDDRAYICTVAAAMDFALGKPYGWKVNGENTFHKTDEQINQQGNIFCQRCQWCLCQKHQRGQHPTIISKTNFDIMKALNLKCKKIKRGIVAVK